MTNHHVLPEAATAAQSIAEFLFTEMGPTGHAEWVGRELAGLGAIIPDERW